MILIDKLIRSNRKTISIQVTKDAKVIVHAPKRISKKYIDNIIEQRENWIKEKKNEAKDKSELMPPHKCIEGESFLYLGKNITLKFSPTSGKVHIEDNNLVVSQKYIDNPQKYIEAFYKIEAKRVLKERCETFSKAEKIPFEGIRITSALTRWGSCSKRKSICFTWRLIMAPLSVIDYVVVHELCHIKHFDHSKKFWVSVAEILPDFDLRRQWLKNNSYLLRKDFFA